MEFFKMLAEFGKEPEARSDGLRGFLVGLDNGGMVPGEERPVPKGYRGLMRYVFWPLEPETSAEAEKLVDEGWMKYEWGTLAVLDLDFVRRYRAECDRQGMKTVVLAIGSADMDLSAAGVRSWTRIGYECASDGDSLVSYIWAEGKADGMNESGLFVSAADAQQFADAITDAAHGPAMVLQLAEIEI